MHILQNKRCWRIKGLRFHMVLRLRYHQHQDQLDMKLHSLEVSSRIRVESQWRNLKENCWSRRKIEENRFLVQEIMKLSTIRTHLNTNQSVLVNSQKANYLDSKNQVFTKSSLVSSILRDSIVEENQNLLLVFLILREKDQR